ncbi:MAG: cytochrome c [Pseudomonadota bacterium]
MRLTSALVGLTLFALTATTASADVIQQRKAKFKEIGGAAKASSQLLRGSFDAAAAKKHMDLIAANAVAVAKLFPEGSGQGDTTAGPKIWSDWKNFEAGLMKLKTDAEAASAAAGKGQKAFAAAFGVAVRNCKECHQTYRVKR